jgi:lambda family phage portal protein
VTDYTFTTLASPAPGPSRSPSAPPTAAPARLPVVRARYDAAERNAENRKLWQGVDSLSARSANSLHVRHTLRTRARYEVANNSYARGIVLTQANDTIGTGPRLQLLTDSPDLNRLGAEAWERWCAEIGLAEKLRTMRLSKSVDGEAFGLLATNRRLQRTGVLLDLKLVEADQVTAPYLETLDPLESDGIRYDEFGNPVSYTVREDHPGDALQFALGRELLIPASQVIHWYRVDRPGQLRGVPEITPALPLFALLRRYTLAVLAAAETAADFAAVLESELPPEDGSAPEPMDALEIERRVMLTLPGGYKLSQLKAEQPTTTYEMFRSALLNEIARCLNMPFNVAAGNSSGYNYASGRLDHQTYYKSILVEQYHAETAVLDRIFSRWAWEAAMTGILPGEFADRPDLIPHQWFWDGWQHVDPAKEANAQATRLKSGTATLADEWARSGHDWREKARQQAEERAYYAELGIPYPGDVAGPTTRDREDAEETDGPESE